MLMRKNVNNDVSKHSPTGTPTLACESRSLFAAFFFFLPSETKPEKTSALNNLVYLRKKPASSSFEIQNRDNLLVSHSERERRLHKTKQRVSVEGDFSSVLRLDQPNCYAHFYLEGKHLSDLCETWQTVYYRCPY